MSKASIIETYKNYTILKINSHYEAYSPNQIFICSTDTLKEMYEELDK